MIHFNELIQRQIKIVKIYVREFENRIKKKGKLSPYHLFYRTLQTEN